MADDIQKNAPVKEIFDELFSLLETLETQNVAIVEFLKEEGIATDEKFAPYLDRAASAANVKWRAHRARMEHLYSPIPAAVQEIKREGESGGKNEAANEELEGKQPSGESEKSREMETSKELGAPNPITGRIPPRQGAAANAEIKTSKESEMPEAGTGEVQQRHQEQPDHVHQVPVEASEIHRREISGAEFTFATAIAPPGDPDQGP